MKTSELYIYLYDLPSGKGKRYRFDMRYGDCGKKKIAGKWRRTLREAVRDRDEFIKGLK